VESRDEGPHETPARAGRPPGPARPAQTSSQRGRESSPLDLVAQGPSGVVRSDTNRSSSTVPDIPLARPVDGPSQTAAMVDALVSMALSVVLDPFTTRLAVADLAETQATSIEAAVLPVATQPLDELPPRRATLRRT